MIEKGRQYVGVILFGEEENDFWRCIFVGRTKHKAYPDKKNTKSLNNKYNNNNKISLSMK